MAKTTWDELDRAQLEKALHNAIYSELLSIKWIKLDAKTLGKVATDTVKEFIKNTNKK